MRLTIIPIDKAVYIDGDAYIDLIWTGTPDNIRALQWKDTSGWIEFFDDIPNEEISSLPAWTENAIAAWQVEYDKNHQPPQPPTAEENKFTATILLKESDWVEIPSVTDPNNNPHLLNKSDFDAYRLELRQFAVNPVAGYITFPTLPKEVWGS